MSFEPGERRRRRELERAREQGARDAPGASATSSSPEAADTSPAVPPTTAPGPLGGSAPFYAQPSGPSASSTTSAPSASLAASASGQPLTRRQLREMREREAALAEGRAADPSGAAAPARGSQPPGTQLGGGQSAGTQLGGGQPSGGHLGGT